MNISGPTPEVYGAGLFIGLYSEGVLDKGATFPNALAIGSAETDSNGNYFLAGNITGAADVDPDAETATDPAITIAFMDWVETASAVTDPPAVMDELTMYACTSAGERPISTRFHKSRLP